MAGPGQGGTCNYLQHCHCSYNGFVMQQAAAAGISRVKSRNKSWSHDRSVCSAPRCCRTLSELQQLMGQS